MATGKTSIMERYIDNKFDNNTQATIVPSFKPKKNENVTNIKIFRAINKKEEEKNAIKRINTNNNLNNKINEELVKSK